MISKHPFGTLPDGRIIERFRLSNRQGTLVDVLSLGGIIQRWELPDGRDIALGFDVAGDYLDDPAYMGALVGRYANRIAAGEFKLDGESIKVATNLQGHCLHGGPQGFNGAIWSCKVIPSDQGDALELTLSSEDGDQGFPGNLDVRVLYQLDDDNRFAITYQARTDKTTVFNPTQHCYFNLAGHESGDILDTRLQLKASCYTPANQEGIPTGELRSVQGTEFDLNALSPLRDRVLSQDKEILAAGGLDHNFCLDGFEATQQSLNEVALAVHEKSSTRLRVFTTMPGIQVYTGNFIPERPLGKGGANYDKYHGFCLESQFYPDSPNQPGFPSAILRPGETFQSKTVYQVEVD